jgi:hypothetical protein
LAAGVLDEQIHVAGVVNSQCIAQFTQDCLFVSRTMQRSEKAAAIRTHISTYEWRLLMHFFVARSGYFLLIS